MHPTLMSPAAGWRRIVIGMVVTVAAVLVLAPAVFAQDTQAQTQKPQARVFTGDVGLMFNVIKADKTADFEMVIGKLKEAMAKSEDPVRKQQAAGWRVFKQNEPMPNGAILYVFLIDPVAKDADYTVSRILAEVFPTEVQELFKVYSDAYAGGVTMANYQLVADLGK
ncbi:MAG: hypothetical protein AB1806_14525 [Acidobacteriota bacterium]